MKMLPHLEHIRVEDNEEDGFSVRLGVLADGSINEVSALTTARSKLKLALQEVEDYLKWLQSEDSGRNRGIAMEETE